MNKTEKKAYEQLKSEGYLVEKPRRTKWQPQDFFYCWDFIAVNDQHIRFIQVSSKYRSQRTREDQDRMLKFPKPASVRTEYWRWNRKEEAFNVEEL